MKLELSSTLPTRLPRLLGELKRPALLLAIARPLLVFRPIGPLARRWSLGEHRFRLLIGGRLPIGEHTINAVRIVTDAEQLPTDGTVWHDAGFSPLIRSWDHRIELRPLTGGGTRYTDRVEIHAGLLTLPAWLFARAFYAHRQRRLRSLALGWRSPPA